jgi:hypothetical protein
MAALLVGLDHRVIAASVVGAITAAAVVLTLPVLRTSNSRLSHRHFGLAEEIEVKIKAP